MIIRYYGRRLKSERPSYWTPNHKVKWFIVSLAVLYFLTNVIPYRFEVVRVEAFAITKPPVKIEAVIIEITDYDRVMKYAEIYGVDKELVDYILYGESHYDWTREGDYDKLGNPHAFGGWQIWPEFHPEVSVKCAHDFNCSTEWAMKKLAKGQYKLWTCGRDFYGKQNICSKRSK